ncbi:hypothetical protein [Methylomarinum vadi]|uniref:hypothetical protein n=1 Tax=Methylomarinum vadi TaxID=438855 RepID=UPI0004DF7B89|nr:hypothetical protein [Methylomarinum vadi]
MKFFESFASLMYLIAAVSLIVLSFSIMAWSIYDTIMALKKFSLLITQMLESVGAIIISIAVLDVAKYLIEEEVTRNKELRSPSEARKTITKIFVIISIAAGMEGLVYIFKAGNENIALLIYPALLIFFSSLSIVCLGIYQKLSVTVEETIQCSNE